MALGSGDRAARLHAEFPGALRGGQVVGYFQPEVELATGRLAGAELLARWEHPEYGTLQPGAFMPIADELGLSRELGMTVLRQAVVQHQAWAAAGWLVPVSVNVGPGCAADPEFPGAVAGLLREAGVAGSMLTIEVSEETGTAANARFFSLLAEAGVRIALDDFGTGFASLESLGDWPVDELKLDQSIVRPVVGSASFQAIVRTTVDLAHQLGMTVVAEGVESGAAVAELRSLGCDVGQGFYLGQPVPVTDFTRWMHARGRLVPRLEVAGRPRAGPPPRPAGAVASYLSAAAGEVRRAVRMAGGWTLATAAVTLAIYGLWQVFRWGGAENQAFISHLLFLPVNAVAVLLAWRVSRRAELGRRTCRAWRLVFIALLIFMTGFLLQSVTEAVLRRTGGLPWSDALYLGVYAFGFAGLITFPARRRSGPERLRLLLDVAVVLIGGLVLIWYLEIVPALEHGFHLGLGDLAVIVQPVGDLLLLFGMLSVIWGGVPRSSVTALRLLAVGMLVFIAGDVSHAYLLTHSGYVSGGPLDILWLLAMVITCVSIACQLRARPDLEFTAPSRPSAGQPSYLPYLAVAASYLLLIVVGAHSVRSVTLAGLLFGAVLLTLLVSARQYATVRDYGRLAVRYQELATIDGLTGLYNRSHFMEASEAAVAHAERLGQPLAALLIDVDSFKRINDVHGHDAGDRVLAEVAQSCRDHVRPGDIVGRYGGDEFTVIVPGATSSRAIQLASHLARPPGRVLDRGGKPLPYTVSIGVAQCPPAGDLTTLLAHADLAMYRAKRAGGNGWRLFMDAAPAAGTGS